MSARTGSFNMNRPIHYNLKNFKIDDIVNIDENCDLIDNLCNTIQLHRLNVAKYVEWIS